jgi:hypothetical protein
MVPSKHHQRQQKCQICVDVGHDRRSCKHNPRECMTTVDEDDKNTNTRSQNSVDNIITIVHPTILIDSNNSNDVTTTLLDNTVQNESNSNDNIDNNSNNLIRVKMDEVDVPNDGYRTPQTNAYLLSSSLELSSHVALGTV